MNKTEECAFYAVLIVDDKVLEENGPGGLLVLDVENPELKDE